MTDTPGKKDDTTENKDAGEDKDPFAGFITTVFKDGVDVTPAPAKTTAKADDSDDEDDESDEEDEDDESDEEDEDDEDDAEDDDGEDSDREGEENDEDEDEIVVETKANKTPAKKRIGQLTKKTRELEAALEVEREVNRRLTASGVKPTEPEKAKPAEVKVDISDLTEPDPADAEKYPYGELDKQYLADVTDYTVEVKLRKRDASNRQREAASQEATEFKTKWEKNIAPGLKAKDMPNFKELVVDGAENKAWPLTPETGRLLIDSDQGARIAYHLAKNPKKAADVASRTPLEQAKWVGKMEDRFAAKYGKDGAKAGTKKTTRAPAPPTSTARARAKPEPTAATTDFAAFEAMVKKQG